MAHTEDDHNPLIFVDGIEDSVLSLIHPKSLAASDRRVSKSLQLFAVMRPGILAQLKKPPDDLPESFRVKFCQLFEDLFVDAEVVGHLSATTRALRGAGS